MSKKKQGSLSARTLELRSEKSLSRQHYQNDPKVKSPSISLVLAKTNQFIEYYHMVKQQHTANLSSKNLFQQTQLCETNDQEFCFDVDLGVPYVQSQHLDSGFEYNQKANEPINFPKVSSAKQIFTSVLDISKSQSNQLEEENFTDQEDNQQKQFGNELRQSSKFQKRSRKEVPPLLENGEHVEKEDEVCLKMENESFVFQDSRISDEEDKILMMQKLKMTVQNRKKKLKFWNNKLVELNKSSNHSGTNSKVTIYGNQQNSSSRINSNSTIFINPQPIQANQIPKSATKRSKFEKEPTNKQAKINLKVDNRQNLSPYGKKVEVRKVVLNPKEQVSKMDTMMKKLKANKENDEHYVGSRVSNKNLSDRRQQILQRKNPKSRSKQIKEKSLTRKVL